MRLTKQEVMAIKNVVYHYDPKAKIFLFGSRVNDELKGGDIDLLIISQHLTSQTKRKIKIMLYDSLGEQKIDIILANKFNKDFVDSIMDEAVLL